MWSIARESLERGVWGVRSTPQLEERARDSLPRERRPRGVSTLGEATSARSSVAGPRGRPATLVLTSESVAEGHPDKVCDYIADSILDAYLELDRRSRVACEVLCKSGIVVLAGEISSIAVLDHLPLVREAVRELG
ncbi:MAG: hypothetical protein DMF81_20780, partial [Acidobacteria bacterium]